MKPKKPLDPAALRRQAEARLAARSTAGQPQTEADLRRLQQELEIHQIELELQNEELQTAQVNLENSLELYTDLFDFAPVGYFHLQADGTICLVNLTGAKLVGIERGKLIQRRFQSLVTETDHSIFHTFLKQVFANESKQTCELTLVGGGPTPLKVRLEAALSPGAQECRVALLDVTEQRQLEQELRQVQKLEAIGQLAGGVAHDFNNILAAMILQTDLLLMLPDVSAELRTGLQDINSYADRAAKLTRQLLLFSRKQVMHVSDLDLNVAVTNLSTMLLRLLGEDHDLRIALHSSALSVRADATMLDQILLNLVLNARDAMPSGGAILVSTSLLKLPADSGSKTKELPPGAYACLTVTDSGSGIPAENLPHMFEPFFTTKAQGKGTGLGLATVYGIAKQHGGAVTVETTINRGSTFKVFLPISPLAVPALPEPVTKVKLAGGSETILLVEDEAGLRDLTSLLFTRAGYKVLSAADGAQALALWQEHKDSIDLLFTDLKMPGGMTGHELADQLCGSDPKLPVVYTSGYSTDLADLELALPPSQRFIGKPAAPKLILSTIREILDR